MVMYVGKTPHEIGSKGTPKIASKPQGMEQTLGVLGSPADTVTQDLQPPQLWKPSGLSKPSTVPSSLAFGIL